AGSPAFAVTPQPGHCQGPHLRPEPGRRGGDRVRAQRHGMEARQRARLFYLSRARIARSREQQANLPDTEGSQMIRMTLSRFVLPALLLGAAAAPALAADKGADYPSRPVTIVSPYSPGGTNDLVSRLLASELSKKSGATFIVENKPGANGSV